MEIKEETLKHLKSITFNGFEITVKKQLTECRAVLLSIGMVESKDKNTYTSEVDLSEQFQNLLETGEYEEKFNGILLSDTERLSSKYVYTELRTAKKTGTKFWSSELYKSSPFKYVPSTLSKLKSLTSAIQSRIGDLKTYHIKISDSISITKSEKDFQWLVGTSYPRTLESAIWMAMEKLIVVSGSVTTAEYEALVDSACDKILNAEISDKLPLKFVKEIADNSITEE